MVTAKPVRSWLKWPLRVFLILLVVLVLLFVTILISTKVSDYYKDKEIGRSVAAVTSLTPNDWAEIARYKNGGAGSFGASRTHYVEYQGEWSLEKAREILKEAGGKIGICKEEFEHSSCRAKFDKYCVALTRVDGSKIKLVAGALYCGEASDFN